MAARPLWKRSLSVVLGTGDTTAESTVALLRSRYSLLRRVTAILFDVDLAAGTSLGNPAPERRQEDLAGPPVRRMRFALAAGAVAAISVAALYSGVALRAPAPTTPPGGNSVLATTGRTTTSTSPAPATPDDEASARALLDQRVKADHTVVESLVGYWVPEVSAKKPGIVVDGVTYDYRQIWAGYQRLATAYPGARLLKSGDYTTFQFPDFWITVVPTPFPTAAAANTWCDSRNIGPSDCFAARMTHTVGSKGNTVVRN